MDLSVRRHLLGFVLPRFVSDIDVQKAWVAFAGISAKHRISRDTFHINRGKLGPLPLYPSNRASRDAKPMEGIA